MLLLSCSPCRCRFIIYKLPRYKVGEVGSGVDYMYLDSSVGRWQMSQFMVNTSQGAIANTLNQLYKGQVYKVSLCTVSVHGDFIGPNRTRLVPVCWVDASFTMRNRTEMRWISSTCFPESCELGTNMGQVIWLRWYHSSQTYSISSQGTVSLGGFHTDVSLH